MANYRIANLVVSMSPQYDLLTSRAKPYLTDQKDIDIELNADGNEIEEYARFAWSFYEQLLKFDGFLVHASTVEWNGKAIAFSAPSGTGKSTHAAYWRSVLGAKIINDDKPAIRWIDDQFCACGTPFSGKAALSRPVCIPLHAVVFLKRGESTKVRRLSTQEALFNLLSQTIRPNNAADYTKLLTLLDRMLGQVSVYEAEVPNNPSSAEQVQNFVFSK